MLLLIIVHLDIQMMKIMKIKKMLMIEQWPETSMKSKIWPNNLEKKKLLWHATSEICQEALICKASSLGLGVIVGFHHVPAINTYHQAQDTTSTKSIHGYYIVETYFRVVRVKKQKLLYVIIWIYTNFFIGIKKYFLLLYIVTTILLGVAVLMNEVISKFEHENLWFNVNMYILKIHVLNHTNIILMKHPHKKLIHDMNWHWSDRGKTYKLIYKWLYGHACMHMNIIFNELHLVDALDIDNVVVQDALIVEISPNIDGSSIKRLKAITSTDYNKWMIAMQDEMNKIQGIIQGWLLNTVPFALFLMLKL
ncbi:hypothetical protein ACJX0J_006863, partial [Zea mays]